MNKATATILAAPIPVKRGSHQRSIIGLKSGRLTAIEEIGRDKRGHVVWRCRCDCGAEKQITTGRFTMGQTRSCGCLLIDAVRESNSTHGRSRDPIYTAWKTMRARCRNPKHIDFQNYGGRGIKVCDRWLHSFENFLADMGERPPGMSIDRHPNKDGDYEPGNCRWATPTEQARNTRRNRMITIEGKTACISEWSEESGVSTALIWHRLNKGWEPQAAVFQKPKH